MSRLTDLIAQAKNKDADLGRELEREFKALASRRSFGLNFERHTPETVELPGRPIRKGDKVRVLPPRGSTDKGDKRLWKVVQAIKADGQRVAELALIGTDEPETQTVPVEDLIVVPNVVVNSKLVQDSGLLKDTINLDVPDEAGDFATVLLRRGTEKLRDITKAWDAYAAEQGESGKVTPLMVLQVPNTPNKDDVGTWLQTIFDTWPELPADSVYNVFGEKKTESYKGHSVPYIAPERVQESDHVRILLAKEAISTGWDCPRAEVMVSFRAASDQTHITQMLGRMVRTPLARRIPGNERLNAVDCLLPNFNQATVKAVVQSLMTGGDLGDKLPGRRVLINPKEMSPKARCWIEET
ncbi:MAG TPA: hypothetical protein VIN05_12380 [Roseovarius sp.]